MGLGRRANQVCRVARCFQLGLDTNFVYSQVLSELYSGHWGRSRESRLKAHYVGGRDCLATFFPCFNMSIFWQSVPGIHNWLRSCEEVSWSFYAPTHPLQVRIAWYFWNIVINVQHVDSLSLVEFDSVPLCILHLCVAVCFVFPFSAATILFVACGAYCLVECVNPYCD